MIENVPNGIRRFLAPFCGRPDSIGHRLAVRLVLFVQRRNEARFERQRDAMMREEERLERALAFSGEAE
jgi:hypothetical protein